MPLDARDKGYLWDMPDAASAVEEFVSGKNFDEYLANRMLRGAVERHIEIIGEAARRVSETTKTAYPEVPRRMSAQVRFIRRFGRSPCFTPCRPSSMSSGALS
jgi:uncharacterized protein with HEPN domain